MDERDPFSEQAKVGPTGRGTSKLLSGTRTPGLIWRRSRERKDDVEAPRQLFVDAHNVLHAWGWLRRAAARERMVAQTRLIEAVRPIHDVEHVEVTIVFDGRGGGGIEAANPEDRFTVVYAPEGKTADDIIEMLVAASPDASRCIVATADGMERQTVRAAGADCVSPLDLLLWSERCRARAAEAIVRRTGKSRASFANKLPL